MYNSWRGRLVPQQEADCVPEQSGRSGSSDPHENLDGTEQQLLVSVPGGAAFPSFSQSGNELCFQGQTSPKDIYVVNVHGTGLTNLTAPLRVPEQPGQPPLLTGDNIRCDWSPKGNAIAFTNGANTAQEIYAIDADGTGLR